MPTIVSPLPRPATVHRDIASVTSPHPFQDLSIDTTASRRVLQPSKLLPPIHITDSRSGGALFRSQSPAPCTPSRRRRGPVARRRRHCARSDCRMDTFGAAVTFDRLPWISAMDTAPSEHMDPWDLADLSQLPANEVIDVSDPTGPGPVRRRKTSLRTNPLASGHPSADEFPLRLRMPLLDAAQISSNPHTPVSQKFNPMEIQFHNLLPIFPAHSSHKDEL